MIAKEVTDLYDIKLDPKIPIQRFGGLYGTIILSTLTVERCEALILQGFPLIKRKAASEKPPKGS